MSRLVLRLTLPLTIITFLLVVLMQVVGKVLPLTQIIPIVIYNSTTVLLVDSNRHIAAALRPNLNVVFDAVVSPDQQKLAFSMADNPKNHIYIGGLYDQDFKQITSETLGGDNPAWSPDGSQLAYVGFEPNNNRGIYTIATDGLSEPQTIVKAGMYASPAWSPDGHELVFAGSRYRDLPDLFVVDSNCRMRCDRQMHQVTNELVADTTPVWSPDGSKVAFLSDRSGDYEIYLLNMDCLQDDQPKCSLQTPRRLRLRRPIVPFLILWSLDAREVYFRGWDAITNQPGLYAVKADCFSLPEGCRPRMIYNLAHVLRGKRG